MTRYLNLTDLDLMRSTLLFIAAALAQENLWTSKYGAQVDLPFTGKQAICGATGANYDQY